MIESILEVVWYDALYDQISVMATHPRMFSKLEESKRVVVLEVCLVTIEDKS